MTAPIYHGPSLEVAAHDVVHEFPGGVPAVARRMGINPGTLGNEVNPFSEAHKLGLVRGLGITLTTQDFRILHAFAGLCGHGAFRLPDLHGVSDEALLDLVLNGQEEVGAFGRLLRDALADGAITKKEMRRLDEQCRRVMCAFYTLLQRLGGLANGR